MRYLGKFEELSPSNGYPSMRESFETAPYEGEKVIANYLKHGHKGIVQIGVPKDVFTGETIRMEKIVMDDGEYIWPNVLAYYVEKYHLRLPKDFEDKVLKK